MQRKRGFPLQILAALLAYSSLAWSQGFGTNVVGSATACDTNKYSQSGPLDSSGQAKAQCNPASTGSAFAKSQADLNLGSQGIAILDDGSANAASLTYDTVTLKPPKGFNGNSVTFTVTDSYAMSIELSKGTGSAKICWTAPRLLNHCATLTHGQGGGTLKAPVTLNRSKSGFQFQITKTMAANITGDAGSGSFATTGDPNFILPKNWKCTFASGVGCL